MPTCPTIKVHTDVSPSFFRRLLFIYHLFTFSSFLCCILVYCRTHSLTIGCIPSNKTFEINHKTNVMLNVSLTTYLLKIMASTTKTLSQIKCKENIGHIKQNFMIIIHLTYVTNGIEVFIKCCIKGWV